MVQVLDQQPSASSRGSIALKKRVWLEGSREAAALDVAVHCLPSVLSSCAPAVQHFAVKNQARALDLGQAVVVPILNRTFGEGGVDNFGSTAFTPARLPQEVMEATQAVLAWA